MKAWYLVFPVEGSGFFTLRHQTSTLDPKRLPLSDFRSWALHLMPARNSAMQCSALDFTGAQSRGLGCRVLVQGILCSGLGFTMPLMMQGLGFLMIYRGCRVAKFILTPFP